MKALLYTLFAIIVLCCVACAPPPFKEVHTYYYVDEQGNKHYFTDTQKIEYESSHLYYKVKGRGGPRYKKEVSQTTINNLY